MTVKAWDNYNNSSLFSSYIQVHANSQFSLDEVMNYPNPAAQVDSTEFQYLLSNDAEKVTLKIFTLSGRMVRNLEFRDQDHITSGYHRIYYNLRDDDNDRLSSGVYIYKIEAVGTGLDEKRRTAAKQSKLVILR
jgi:hypothetical protein